MLEIHTQSERRLVNDKGEITRAACDWKYSGDWLMLGLVRNHGWGVAEYIPFTQVADRLRNGLQLRYKNGKPRYTVRDCDHGTTREWGDMVVGIREISEPEDDTPRSRMIRAAGLAAVAKELAS